METLFTTSSDVPSLESVSKTTTVRPPRNAQRLNRSTNTTSATSSSAGAGLGPPVQLDFKVPSLPHRSSSVQRDRQSSGPRSPLAMSEHINIPPSPVDASTSTPNRLKRLSLVARPPSLAVSPEAPDAAPSPLSASIMPQRDSMRTPRGTRVRSSISYSPGPGMHTPRSAGGMERSSWDMHRSSSRDAGLGAGLGPGVGLESPIPTPGKGETWSDKHSDLLQSIAQKQRRINELKQELQAEQEALYSLKGRWASLVNSSFSPPPTAASTYPPGATPSSLSHRTTESTSTTQTEDQWTRVSGEGDRPPVEQGGGRPGFHSLLDDVLGDAPLVDPSVVEGGRRFIGNLMRTVGAAAGGTVPEAAAAEPEGKKSLTPGAGGMDLSGIRGMFSWTSSAPVKSSTVRIRPADLPRNGTTRSRTPTPPESSV